MSKKKKFHVGACGTCYFWELQNERTGEGYQNEGVCRKRPPSPIPSDKINFLGENENRDGPGYFVAWPITFEESDWCGEFVVNPEWGGKPKEEK